MEEKQIEEMTKEICPLYKKEAGQECDGELECDFDCTQYEICKALFEKGYRKASDVAREILALIWDAYQTTHYDSEFEERFDRISKKYESEGKK